MKVAVTFFLLLCFHLLGGYDAAQAVTLNSKAYYPPTQTIEKAQLAEGARINQDYILTTDESPDSDKEYLVGIEDDCDDEIKATARKFVLLTKSFLTSSLLSLINPFNSFKEALPFFKHFHYLGLDKYLLQRVLRL